MAAPTPPTPLQWSKKTWAPNDLIRSVDMNNIEDGVDDLYNRTVVMAGDKVFDDGMSTDDVMLADTGAGRGFVYHNGTKFVFQSLNDDPIKFARSGVVANSKVLANLINGVLVQTHADRHKVTGDDPFTRYGTMIVGPGGDFSSIGAANSHGPGLIIVKPGTYNGNIGLSAGRSIIGLGRVIINGAVNVGDNALVENLAITGGTSGTAKYCIRTYGSNVYIRNNIIEAYGMDWGIKTYKFGTPSYYEKIHITGNTIYGADYGIMIESDRALHDIRITNNHIFDVNDYGISFGTSGRGVVDGNNIRNGGQYGIRNVSFAPGHDTMCNNYIEDFQYGIRAETYTPYALAHGNVIKNCTNPISLLGVGNVSADNKII